MTDLPADSVIGVTVRSERVISLVAAGVTAYLAVTVYPMVRYATAARDWLPLVVHLVVLALAALTIRRMTGRRRLVRDWLPLALGPYLYIELRWLIEGLGRPHMDATVILWERRIFPGDPSHALAIRFPGLAVSELLHACYLSYYALVLVPPALLYLRARREAYAATTTALVLVYLACFSCFLFFPVDGPRFLVGPAAAPAGPVRSLVLQLLQAGSSRGTAFPSSHVAASVVAALCALRHQRRVGYVTAAFATGLTLSTVYGGFHYGVDALAGLAVGLVASGGAWWLWRAIPGEA